MSRVSTPTSPRQLIDKMPDSVKNIKPSVIDGTAKTPRYRERQLAKLHEKLVEKRSRVVKGIAEESQITDAEATAQYLLMLNAIKIFHESVNPKACHEAEYRIAEGKNDLLRRVPYGCAYIIPSAHDGFYSTIVPIAAAIAAGNAVVLELPQTTDQFRVQLKTILSHSLASEVFAIVNGQVFDEQYLTMNCIVLDGTEAQSVTTSSQRISTSSRQVVAVIDRSANIVEAAKECVKSRFGFGGRSPYAPDYVLVNEFVVKQFRAAVIDAAASYFSANSNDKAGDLTTQRAPRKPKIHEKLEKSSAEVVISGNKGTIAMLRDRDSGLLTSKTDSPLLVIVPISSMDDAINMISGHGQTPSRLRASFVFAQPAAAKYLGQYIDSSITSANHIPTELLIGPPAPDAFDVCLQPRYTAEMFSLPSPQIIQKSPVTDAMALLLSADRPTQQSKKVEEELDVALRRVSEPFGPPIGFFEQGILFGLSCILITVITATGLAVKYAGPPLLAKVRRS